MDIQFSNDPLDVQYRQQGVADYFWKSPIYVFHLFQHVHKSILRPKYECLVALRSYKEKVKNFERFGAIIDSITIVSFPLV